VVMAFAGLRGAVSFALALTFPEPSAKDVISTTIVAILVSTLLLGGLTAPLVHSLGIRKGAAPPAVGGAAPRNSSAPDGDPAANSEPLLVEDATRATSTLARGWLARQWRTIDRRYLQHWFGGPESALERRHNRAPSLAGIASMRSQLRSGASLGRQRSSYADARLGYALSERQGSLLDPGVEPDDADADVRAILLNEEREAADDILFLVRAGSHDPFLAPLALHNSTHRQPPAQSSPAEDALPDPISVGGGQGPGRGRVDRITDDR
jgi:hypothetical protein